jgi:hypothetical protein
VSERDNRYISLASLDFPDTGSATVKTSGEFRLGETKGGTVLADGGTKAAM